MARSKAVLKIPVLGEASPAGKNSRNSAGTGSGKLSVEQRIFRIFVALLLDILAFTIILPLFPSLLQHYREQSQLGKDPFFGTCLAWVQAFKLWIGGSGSKLDIVLFGGAMGSLFSLLQFLVSPHIGKLSDQYGRKRVLLWTMWGNIVSALLWLFSNQFYLFVLSRVVGGLSEGNVQLSIAMISDLTTPQTRSRGLALVGIAFALGFTVGPPLGAYFASLKPVNMNTGWLPSVKGYNSVPAAAALCVALLLVETWYLWWCIEETKPGPMESDSGPSPRKTRPSSKQQASNTTIKANTTILTSPTLRLLSWAHFAYLFFFSGMEFTLTFLTFDRFQFTNMQQGYWLGTIGILSSLIQGGYVRRAAHRVGERKLVRQGISACFLAFLALAFAGTDRDPFWNPSAPKLVQFLPTPLLTVATVCFAFASATVVNGLTSLASLLSGVEYTEGEKGAVLGRFRSSGQLGRALGPMVACSTYWLLGSMSCYVLGALGILLPLLLLLTRLPGSSAKSLKSN